ncbi:MAG TPA: alpha/beta hydrolase [Bryobacteraceae bacterium]|jgi:acetyl esterase
MPESIKRSDRLDPEARALLEFMDAQGGPPLESLDPAEARATRTGPMAQMGGEPEPLERIQDISIPGPATSLPARIYATTTGGLRPGYIYFHGGGFVFGNLDTHDTVCRSFAKQSGAVVVSVDYRLAPEHKFPAAVDDCYAAVTWVAANTESLGIDRQRIAIGGDSAGGNLATVAAMRCRDAGGPPLVAQILVYPVADLSSQDTPSHRECGEAYFLTSAAMTWFNGHYLPFPDLARHPEASPFLAPNVAGLPPALVITAEFDPLRDEGEAYARRMREAGVPVTISRYPGMIHGFVSMHGMLNAGRQAIREAAEFLQSAASSVDARRAAIY